MKKQIKIVLAAASGIWMTMALPAAAFDAAASVSTSSAASPSTALFSEGWRQEGGAWAYYDQAGQRAVNTWVRSGDGETSYYLDEQGYMAINRLIEDSSGIRYVDGDGAMVQNRWASVPNDGLWSEPVNTVYYYFDSKGRAVRDTKKSIDGKIYFFDNQGRMLSGWYEDGSDLYYLGTEDEGWVCLGWHCLVPKDPDESSGMARWFYFRYNNGKAYKGRKKIDGSFYYFDEDTSIMQEGWIDWEEWHAYYEPVTGKLKTGWIYCDGPEHDEEAWYYLDDDGVPFNEGGKDFGVLGDGSALDYVGPDAHDQVAARTIQGDTYLFDKNGKMMTGQFYLWSVQNKGGPELGGRQWVDGKAVQGACYFFDDQEGPSRGKMLRGKHRIMIDGTAYDYHFRSDGRAYLYYIVDGYLYGGDGTRIKAKDGDRYEIVDLSEEQDPVREKGSRRIHDGGLMIVDRNGRAKKNGKVVIEDYRYTVKNYDVIGTELVD